MAITELTKEIATVRRDITQPLFGGLLLHADDTLLSRGQGKGLKIYDELERDTHAYAVLQKRKMAVVSREWDIEPASKKAKDAEVADFVRATLKALPFDDICRDLLEATLKGFAVGEILWEARGDSIVPAEILQRDPRRFVFDEDRKLRLLTHEHPLTGEIMPERKFIIHRFGGKNGSPYGLGLGHKLFWPVYFKRQDITFWLTFADKFGSPTALGRYPNGASPDEQKKLLDALRAISQDAGVIVPEGMLIELLEAARSGSVDTYEKLARYMDEQISEAVLGETLTTNVGQIGSHAASQTHNDVRAELAKADGDLLSDTLNNTLIKWLVDLNRPGAAYPKLWRDFSEPEDLKARAERDQIIYNMGFEPDETYVTITYGEGWRKRAPAGTGPMPAFAEGTPAPSEVATPLTDQMAERASAPLKTWLDRIRGMVEEAESLPALRDRLLAAYGDLPSDDLAQVMALGFAAADLAGRFDVADEIGALRGLQSRSGA